ncbi:MAG TPA: DUF5674 family protein [Candidatus Bathyarchaeia archaeon]|nr:DUF5674 family protein [Candidatus Bathyarchaeia archaeon]
MKFFDSPLALDEIKRLQDKWGDYLKVTVDIENRWLVAGGELHADGERILLKKGSRQDDIWGGGINLKDKQVDATAVLNIRPKLGNDNLEVLDPERRKKFVEIVKEFFKPLWA